jgi:hypothetical protein
MHAHHLNVDAAHREIAARAAEGEPMEHAFVDPATSAVVFKVGRRTFASSTQAAEYVRGQQAFADSDFAGMAYSQLGTAFSQGYHDAMHDDELRYESRGDTFDAPDVGCEFDD